MIKKMKGLDVLNIVCIVFLVALILLGKDTTPLYLFAIEMLLIVVMLIALVINIRYKTKVLNNTTNVIRSIRVEDFEGIKEAVNENFGGYISEEIETLLEEVVSKNENMKHVMNLAKYIEKDEIDKFKIREIEMDSGLRYALRVFIKQKELLDSSQMINTEFLKKIKSNKFGEIEIDDDNVTEQQLNSILKSFEVIDKNLKSTQPAFYEGDFNVEIETVDIEKDYLNITSRLGTLLTSQKKSIINLYYAILMLEEFDHQEIISSSYKGNLVHNFRALETVYENLTVSIENIAYAIEHKVNISYEHVSEIFRPIIDTINKDEVFTNDVPEKLDSVNNENISVIEDEFGAKILNSKSNFETKHFTKNHELILDIENRLKDMQIVFDEELHESTEETENEVVETKPEVAETLEEVENKEIIETLEEVENKEIIETLEEVENKEVIETLEEVESEEVVETLEVVEKLEEAETLEVVESEEEAETLEVVESEEEVETLEKVGTKIEEVSENSLETLIENDTTEKQRDDDLTDELENINDVQKSEEQIVSKSLDNNKFDKPKINTSVKPETKTVNTWDNYKKNNSDVKDNQSASNSIKYTNNINNVRNELRSEKPTTNSATSRLNDNKGGRRVSSITNNKTNTKKPLTYQEAMKSGEIDKFKTESTISYANSSNTVNNIRKRIEPIKNRGEKEPVTYQQFLKDKGNPSRPAETSRTNTTSTSQTTARKPVDTKTKTTSRFATNQSASKEFDSAKKRSKLVENLGRELSQRERAELDLYGEILDDKTRTKMDLITSGTDLAGF